MKARKSKKQGKLENQEQNRQRKAMLHALKPLIYAFVTWFFLKTILHLPGILEVYRKFMIDYTSLTAYWFGRILFVPIEMPSPTRLIVNGFAMRVVMECTAYTFYIFAIALVIFARWPLRHKFSSLGIMLVLIFIMNNMRFIVMGYVGTYWPDYFDIVHDIIWNVLFGFLVFGLWLWREMGAQKKPANA